MMTMFCLGTFTTKCLKHDFCFKLGSVSSSFSFRHQNSPFNEIVIVAQSCFREWSSFPVAVQLLTELTILYHRYNMADLEKLQPHSDEQSNSSVKVICSASFI